jgi:hypothetical protein
MYHPEFPCRWIRGTDGESRSARQVHVQEGNWVELERLLKRSRRAGWQLFHLN